MDSDEVKKRLVNDVTPPALPSAPTVVPRNRQTIAISEDVSEPQADPLLPPSEYVAQRKVVPSPEKVIAVPAAEPTPVPSPVAVAPVATEPSEPEPVPAPEEFSEPEIKNSAAKEIVELPAVNPLPETPITQKIEQAPVEDKDEPVADSYQVSDALPDTSERTASAIKEGMQDPKLYDTTAYHVPIKETHHSHGGLKAALAFGIVFAAAVVGGAIYLILRLGS